jgi:hypothetical protein
MNTDMKKQTAVEWLFAHLLPFLEFSDPKEREHFRKCLAEAKEMEKEQTEDNMAHAITFGWELSHYHRDKEPEKLLQMQKDFIITVIKGGDK